MAIKTIDSNQSQKNPLKEPAIPLHPYIIMLLIMFATCFLALLYYLWDYKKNEHMPDPDSGLVRSIKIRDYSLLPEGVDIKLAAIECNPTYFQPTGMAVMIDRGNKHYDAYVLSQSAKDTLDQSCNIASDTKK